MTVRTLAALVVALTLALVASSTASAATGWRTIVVASAGDTSPDGAGVDMTLATTMRNVRELRLVARTDLPLKTSVRVRCERSGRGSAERSIRLQLRSGTTKLPVPLAGGDCSVSVSAYNFEPGTADVRVQVRS